VRTAEQLHVRAADNLDFHSLAVRLSGPLPRRFSDRARLGQLVHAPSVSSRGGESETTTQDGLDITRWRLRMGDDWTVPAVELSPAIHSPRHPGGGRRRASAAPGPPATGARQARACARSASISANRRSSRATVVRAC
jgi:hypothetical protein